MKLYDKAEYSRLYDETSEGSDEPEQEDLKEQDVTQAEQNSYDDKKTENDHEEEDQARQFDHDDYKGVVFDQKDILCNLQGKAGISSSWIVLDSQLTVEVYCNSRMLSSIHDAIRHQVLLCNADTTSVTNKGDLKGVL